MAAKLEIQRAYAMTPLQEGMLYHALMDEGSNAYVQQLRLTIEGKVDFDCMRASIQELVDRYESFRMNFFYRKLERPRQIVFAKREAVVAYHDCYEQCASNVTEYAERLLAEERRQGFDMEKEALIRFAIIRTDERRYTLALTFHHIIMDGWCFGIVMEELLQIYDAQVTGQSLALRPVASFGSYIDWLEQRDKDEARAYWKSLLAGYDTPLSLPGSLIHPQDGSYELEVVQLRWTAQDTALIQAAAARMKVTLNVLFQAVWGMMLARYNGTNDVVFGAVVSGRPPELNDVERMVGLFINTIPVRVQLEPMSRMSELAVAVQRRAIESMAYDYCSLADIQAEASMREPLFDHIFVCENYPLDESTALASEQLQINGAELFDQTHYHFNIELTPGTELVVRFEYNHLMYDREWIESVASHMRRAFEAIVSNPDIAVKDIPLLTDREIRELLIDFNGEETALPPFTTILQWFESQAAIHPDLVAVVCGNEEVTYRQLNRRANYVAQLLREQKVSSQSSVAIMVERSVDMISSVLGVWKAGAAYVPIDPEYPQDRIQYMLGDSQAQIVLINVDAGEELFRSYRLIDLRHVPGDASLNEMQDINPVSATVGDDLAYIMYTSGTTGNPKGVMIEHHNLVNVAESWRLAYKLDSFPVRLLQLASFSFDVFVGDICRALLNKGCMVIATEADRFEFARLHRYILHNQISILESTPALLVPFMEYVHEQKLDVSSLRLFIVGADACSNKDFKALVGRYGSTLRIVNSYGVTEASIDSSFYEEAAHSIAESGNAPIGKPMHNMQYYILDPSLNLVAKGLIGELYIGGKGVARGYWNRTELTAERFIPNPYQPGEKMYRTGDLARWRPDGNVEFIGRSDHQVKIRGYRIELGEIEGRLLQMEMVNEALVSVVDIDGEPHLCAYVVAERDEWEPEQVKEALGLQLPSYMVPTWLIRIEQLPLTPNGKIDRKALPLPNMERDDSPFEAPRSETEQKLQLIWQDVLSTRNIGIFDSFFEKGGHSLKAIILISKIDKVFQVQISLKQIFQHHTIAAMAQLIEQSERGQQAVIERVASQPFYPVSSAQKRLLVLNQFEAKSTAYNMNTAIVMEGVIDHEKLESVFQSLVDRHESLRTTFEMREGNPVQIVHESFMFKLDSWEIESSVIDEQAAIAIAMERFVQPFDPGKLPLIRAALIRLEQNKAILLIDLHHIVTDGTSVEVIIEEFAQLYNGDSLPSLSHQYKDYACWQQKLLNDEKRNSQEKFWLDSFQGEIPVLAMTTDYARPAVKSYAGAQVVVEWDERLVDSLQQLVSRTRTTLYMVLLAAYNVLLHKYTGQEDVIVGSPSAGRGHADLQRVVGMFVNTLAMRNYPRSEMTFEAFLQEVTERSLQVFEHQEYPFEELISKLGVQRDMSRNPLFDTMLVLQNTDAKELRLDGLRLRTVDFDSGNSKFDLVLSVAEQDGRLRLELSYATALFEKGTIERLAEHLYRILETVAAKSDVCLFEIELLSESERHEQLQLSNSMELRPDLDTTLAARFAVQTELHPDRIAVCDIKKSLTYSELDRTTNQWAHKLREYGVKRDTIVAVMAEPGIEMIVGIISVLKAGGAYLPLDPYYPAERIGYIQQEAGFNIVMSESQLPFPFAENTERFCLDNPLEENDDDRPLTPVNVPSDLAYVIYTSGTTGAGKGVMIEQRSVINLIDGLHKLVYSRYEAPLNVALIAPFVFDASVKQIFAALLLGHTLHIAPRDVRSDAKALSEFYSRHEIDLSDGTPTHIRMLNALPDNSRVAVRHYLIGGETLHFETARQWIERCSPHKPVITNVYGPTECTVDATSYTIDTAIEGQGATVPIGTPLPNVRVYVLGSSLEILPRGAIGFLYIGGAGVARGYFNREELTNESFVPNPYVPGERMYKTGDRARWLPDGTIEFLGRNDHQIKIRGYRIETGEIESALLTHAEVESCIVLAVDGYGDTKQLCAYVAAKHHAAMGTEAFRSHLANHLPDYMIPAYFVFMSELPMTSNGKIDRRALPDPDIHTRSLDKYEAPAIEMERVLVEIWEEVLGISPIGVEHNFFELGGDSIKAIQIAAQLSGAGYTMEIRQLFRHPTVRSLSGQVVKNKHEIPQQAVEGEIPLTPIQQRFFENTAALPPHHYNQSVVLFRSEGIDAAATVEAFQQLTHHHDALRIRFTKNGEKYVQWNAGLDNGFFKLIQVTLPADLEQQTWEAETERLQSGLDIEKGPLISLGIFDSSAGSYLLIIMHHLLVDGVSWRIIIEDFIAAYEAISSGKQWTPPLKSDSYRDWAQALVHYAATGNWKEEISYWAQISQQEITRLPGREVHCDRGGVPRSGIVALTLDHEETSRLLGAANRAYRTEINDLLLVALGSALKQWTGTNKFAIDLEGHGREQLVPDMDVSRTVGWFTSVFPVILDMNSGDNWSDVIRHVKEGLRRIPNKGAAYGILKYLCEMENESPPRFDKVPEILFNYLGQVDTNQPLQGFVISDRPAGSEMADHLKRLYPLEISGMVSGGQLTIHLAYDADRFEPSAIERLAQIYTQSLKQVVDHCCSQQSTTLTPDDLTYKSMSIDQLDRIAGLLKQKIKQ
ncbi:non-ribosomal peptide synthetase [Paenibacillus fonticola]|uniref:non-ribosomal peptide synthetase n=1 Tax=Paenibacillus fonticola TaxID=379896 RepID=UPI0003A277DB|nr:non-ribosomal peptide synthetase [Paenibacillus fonticola]